jgi:catechol 2,3-dioxygenase-like lactoylglutathione lyase family enzyme
MPVVGLDHVNIRTMDVEASVKFYVEAFGFEYRKGPLVMGNQAHWLCDAKGQPIIHFRELESESTSTGPFDHVALACQNKAELLARLRAHGVAFSMVENLLPGVTQVVLKDPHGITVELQVASE